MLSNSHAVYEISIKYMNCHTSGCKYDILDDGGASPFPCLFLERKNGKTSTKLLSDPIISLGLGAFLVTENRVSNGPLGRSLYFYASTT